MVRRIGVDLTACWRPRAGMATVAIELTRHLLGPAGADRELTLFCSRERPSGLGSLAAGSRAVLSPHRHEVLNKLRWLPAVEGEAGLDAMLYPYWPCPPRRRRGAPPAAMVVHDLAYRVRPREVPWQQRVYMGSIVPGALRRAGAVLTPSEATRRDLLDQYPLPGLEPGFLLAVGTIEPRKNYPRLLAAYRLLRARAQAPPLVVVGRVGWAYGTALDELRAEPGVRLLSDVDDAGLRALYRSAGALAFPSLYEGFGLPLLEAMAEGLPALAGAAGALPELAGDAALLVDPTDVEALADGLGRVLGDGELRARLSAAGPQRASRYTWEAAAAATLEVLDTLR